MTILKAEAAQALMQHLELIDYHLDALRAPLGEARRESTGEIVLAEADVTKHLAPAVLGQSLRDTAALAAMFGTVQQQISDLSHAVESIRREAFQEVSL